MGIYSVDALKNSHKSVWIGAGVELKVATGYPTYLYFKPNKLPTTGVMYYFCAINRRSEP